MAFLGMSEGLGLLLLLFALLLLALFIARRVMFSLRLRKVRKENMELANHMKKKLKSARFRSSSDFEEEADEMFKGPRVRAKALVIPASYEARLAKTRKKARKRRATKASPKKPNKRKEGGNAAFKPESARRKRSRKSR